MDNAFRKGESSLLPEGSAAVLRYALPAILLSTAAAAEPPPGFVRLSDVAPDVSQEIRYAGAENFTGRPVPGYGAAQCWLRREAAEALARARDELARERARLVVYDCYRPARATAAFLAWAADASDQVARARYYPRIDKRELFARSYIGGNSSHSLGLAVDLAIVGLDFGTTFDMFDARSATRAPGLPAAVVANRRKLVDLMARHGFENFRGEWWHFKLRGITGAKPLDVEIR